MARNPSVETMTALFTMISTSISIWFYRADVLEYMASVGYNHMQHSGTSTLRHQLGTINDLFIKKGIEINVPKTEL